VLGGRHDGWVLLLEDSDDPHPHDLAEHRVLVEQAAPIVGTEMLRLRSVQRAKEQARGDFVHGLLHGRFATQEDIGARAAHYEFPVRSWFGVLIASGITVPSDADSPVRLQQVAVQVARLLPEQERHTLAAMVGDVLVVVREAARRGTMGTPEAAIAAIGDYATVLHAYLAKRKDQGGRPVRVTYGRPVVGALSIPDSYREARMAPRPAAAARPAAGVRATRSCGCTPVLGGRRPSRHRAARSPATSSRRCAIPNVGDLESAVLALRRPAAATSTRPHATCTSTEHDALQAGPRLAAAEHGPAQADNQFAVWLAHTLDLLANTTAEVDRVVRPH
jgi:hypothetical protein